MKKLIKSELNKLSNVALRLVLADCLDFISGSASSPASLNKRVLKAIANNIRSRVVCSGRMLISHNEVVAAADFWRSVCVCECDDYWHILIPVRFK